MRCLCVPLFTPTLLPFRCRGETGALQYHELLGDVYEIDDDHDMHDDMDGCDDDVSIVQHRCLPCSYCSVGL
jgi:hypothetical protein